MADYPETKFKSAYQLGDKLLNFFLNYRDTSKSFTFIIKKGNYSFIYNLTSEEKLPFMRACMRELTVPELQQLWNESRLDKGY